MGRRVVKVAIFKVNQLGDNVIFLPVVQTLRRLYPAWELALFTSPTAAPLYSGLIAPDCLRAQQTADFNGAWKRPRRFLSLLAQVRHFRPDACLLANDQGNVAHLLARLSGAICRVGIKPAFLKFAPRLTVEVSPPVKMHAATLAWETGRALVRQIDRDGWPAQPPAPDLGHLTNGQSPIANRVVIHPGASQDYQRWPIERFAELARRLAARWEVCWIESAEVESRRIDAPIRRIRPSSILELTQTLASAELFVGNNSGPMNLVFAMGRPSVILNGPTTRLWDPFWYPERTLMLRDLSLSCLACDTIDRAVKVCHNSLAPMTCLRRWSVDQVEALCHHWLQRWQTVSTN
jgi:ADP-heptose:LPS heptosyltransferase